MGRGDEGDARPDAPGSALSPSRLAVRRAAAKRRRSTRRAAFAAGLLVALAALVALIGGGGGGHQRRPAAAVASTRPPVRPPRVGRGVARVLAYTPYVALAGRRRREVALTFDDGPGPSTPRILAILRRSRAPATFFVTGRSTRADPRMVAAEARAGFVVGDHTETHPLLARLSMAAQDREITQAADDIRRAGAPYPTLFRPPYGSFDPTTLTLLHADRLLMVLWSADTKDFSRPGVKQITYNAISAGQPGAIILMHDGSGVRDETAAALPRIIARLRQRGYRLVTVPELLADDPPPARQPPPRPLSGLL